MGFLEGEEGETASQSWTEKQGPKEITLHGIALLGGSDVLQLGGIWLEDSKACSLLQPC